MVFIFMMTMFPAADNSGLNSAYTSQQAVFETVLTINIGSGEQEAGYTPEIEGIANDGPSSFTLDDDKNIYILDTLNKKIMVFKNAKWEGNIDISYTEHGRDILFANESLYLLDEPNKVYKLSLDGTVQDIYDLPDGIEAYMVERLSIDAKGEIVAQSEGEEYSIITGSISEGYTLKNSGKKISLKTNNESQYIIDENGNELADITYAEMSGSVELLDGDMNGNTYIAVQDDIPDSPLVLLEYTIRKLDEKGNKVGFARVPLEDYSNFPNRFINITNDGKIYIMALKADCVEIDEVKLDSYP